MRCLRPPLLRACAGLLVAVATAQPVAAEAPRRAAARARSMVTLPAGTWRPLYGRAGDAPARVASFRLDRDPVTRGAFLAFVVAHPAWRRDAVQPAHAARPGYLAGWPAPLDAGGALDRRRPVTAVSWYAARAYCAAQDKRLPTVAEWEYAAAASERASDATRDPAFVQDLVSTYARRPRLLPPVGGGRANHYGVRGLHDLAWEWTADFGGAGASGVAHGVGAQSHEHDLYCASAAIGAADPSNYAAFLRYAIRAGLTGRTTMGSLGFRCAR